MRLTAALVAGLSMVFGSALMAQDTPAPEPKPAEKPADPAPEKPKESEKAPEGDKKEEPKKEEKKEELSDVEKMFKGLDEVTGKIEATDADFKAYIKHGKELETLTEADEKLTKLLEKNMKEGFDALIKHEKYLAFAKSKELDAEKFARATLRVMTTYLKVNTETMLKTEAEKIDAGVKELEKMKMEGELTEEQFKKAMIEVEQSRKQLADVKKALKMIPGPTEAETKLLAANKAELDKLLGESAAEEEDEDGMDG
jgi:hypothetical protein